MVDFITSDCNPAGQIDFFHSGAYTRPSFSTSWRTADTPETNDLGSTPVYLQVLDKFNIPVDSSNGLPPAGFLPGIDIKNMDALSAIRFSMAEALTVGQWWEMYEDGFGGVKFLNVYNDGSPGKTITLDVRLCIPSASKKNEVDMVIVRGYDPPPQRFAGPFRDVVPAGLGTINPQAISGNEKLFTVHTASLATTCVNSHLNTIATKSYQDPVFTNSLGPQEKNPFYDVKAHEKIITYAIDVSGMPTSADEAAKVKYSFNSQTVWYFRPTPRFPAFNKRTDILVPGCSTTGIQTSDSVVFYEGEISYVSPTYSDRYGSQWPLVAQPESILYFGYKVDNIVNFGGASTGSTFVYVSPIPEMNAMSEGSQWVYTITDNTYNIKIYYQPKTIVEFWDEVLRFLDSPNTIVKVNNGAPKQFLDSSNDLPNSATGIGILGGQNNLGHLITDLWLGMTVDRPSVTVTDVSGNALQHANNLRVQYAPLILLDKPRPIAYKHKDFGSVIVDQTVGLEDSDPTTCQSFEDTPLGLMQDRSAGNTIDVTFPFCENETVCLRVAEVIFDYQNYTNAQTFTLTCGPDDDPELGAAVTGYDANLRIESISYSYQDASAYTVEVTLGPVFSNIGSQSWNNGAWAPKTQDVSRKGIVRFVAGDGVNYRVYVQGLGEFNAINASKNIWRSGEVVDVTVYNIPQEK